MAEESALRYEDLAYSLVRNAGRLIGCVRSDHWEAFAALTDEVDRHCSRWIHEVSAPAQVHSLGTGNPWKLLMQLSEDRFVRRKDLAPLELGTQLWSINRGHMLHYASYISTRERGDFRRHFYACALGEVRFMWNLLEMSKFLHRLEAWCDAEVSAKRLEARSFLVLREIWCRGALERGRVSELTHVGERQGREIVSRLLLRRVISSATPRGPLRMQFPREVAEEWFPGLFPAAPAWV